MRRYLGDLLRALANLIDPPRIVIGVDGARFTDALAMIATQVGPSPRPK